MVGSLSTNGAAHTSPGQRPISANLCVVVQQCSRKVSDFPWKQIRTILKMHRKTDTSLNKLALMGQRPGYASSLRQALKGRLNRCLAPSGLGMFLSIEPRALPWAGISRPFGAAEGGLGYGG